MGNEYLRNHFAGLVKQFVWNSTIVEKSDEVKDIFILTTRRSGSTWFAEVLSADKGNKLIDQPLSILRLGLGDFAKIPIMESSQFISLSSYEEEKLKRYIEAILSGERHINEPWRFWESTFSLKTKRHVLKITDASSLIEWFNMEFNAHVVYLVRHPIPQALSCIDRKWSLTSKAYLNNKFFVDNYLTNGLEGYSWDIWNNGNELENFVLNWVVENVIPLSKITTMKECMMFNYEENVLFPFRTIDLLVNKLNLSDADLLRKRFYKPSKNMDSGTNAFNKLENLNSIEEFKFMIERWRKKVSTDDEKRAMKILEKFELDVYMFGELAPSPKYCNFIQ